MPRKHVVCTGGFRGTLVAAPESTALGAGAVGVPVGWGRAETLFALVVAGVEELEENRDQKEETGRSQISKEP